MKILNIGEYTGEIIHRLNVEGSIITNTHYSIKENNNDWHYHENLHICYVYEGGRADTLKESQYTQKGGSIFFYHSGEKHRWTPSSIISKSANIEVSSKFLDKYERSEDDIKNALNQNIAAKTLILKMQHEMLLNDISSSNSVHTLLLELVNDSKKIEFSAMPNWVIRLTELLHEDWNEPTSLSYLALNVGVHPVTISKNFRKYFSCTLGEYQRRIRIEKSIELIKNSNISLSEIAHLCGFADQSHFIRNFKQLTGFLPKHFQKF
ncbi:AraC family transcriptional regulator [Pontimicrobium sp. SW4]|uniref:AraC family transcriptional regulator n=1 Tax=Pontimicrobium sp. SW4 TaxID=3153519 RepID=A0AAU7BVT1_9FLAO